MPAPLSARCPAFRTGCRRLPNRLASCRRLALALACAFWTPAYAQLPGGAAIISGSAAIATSGSQMTISNSPNAIVNWQSFSIGAQNRVHFEQQATSSQILNRVIGTDPSQIFGALSSNGRVWLINRNGIVFGPNARIDVAGLVASTLDISNLDFLANRFFFAQASEPPAEVLNQGEIRTSFGGRVWLLGDRVRNEGLIASTGGQLALAAGRSIELIDSALPNVVVRVSAPENDIVNLGSLLADSGRIDLHGSVVNQEGIVRADSVAADALGRVILKASQAVKLGETSQTMAAGAFGGQVVADATLGTTLVAGRVSASGETGEGGQIHLLGRQVGVYGHALVDASGVSGGGEILLGGDYQGRNPAIRNAMATFVGPEATLVASARAQGDGGRVVVWADESTRVYGSLAAGGGAAWGNGGFIETSGGWLDARPQRIDVSAPRGSAGTWLLDPNNITIANQPTQNVGGNPIFTSTNDSAVLNAPEIAAALASGANVTVRTGTGGSNGEQGNITVAASIVTDPPAVSPGSLTLSAHNDIVVNADVSIRSVGAPLNVTLTADSDGNNSGGISMSAGAQILSNGGNIVFQGGGADGAAVGRAGNAGIVLSAATLDATLGNDSRGGTIQLKGHSSSTGGSGVLIRQGSTIRSAGGSVTILGDATAAATEDNAPHGVDIARSTISGGAGVAVRGDSQLDDGIRLSLSTIESVGGSVQIVGTSGTSYGVLMLDRTAISADRSIELTGDTTSTSQAGLVIETATLGGSAQRGDIILRARNGGVADSIRLARSAVTPATSIQTSGSLVLVPGGPLTGEGIVNPDTVQIGVGTSSGTGFELDPLDLSTIHPATGGVIIGSDRHVGRITAAAGGLPLHGNLTLQNEGAGSQGIGFAGFEVGERTLALATAGPLTQESAGTIVAGALLLRLGSVANVALTGQSNAVQRLAVASPAAFGFVNSGPLVIASVSANGFSSAAGTVQSLTVSDSSSAGDFLVRTLPGSSLTLAQGISTTGTGSAITLVSGADFNNAGGSLTPGAGGRWLVYAADPATSGEGLAAYRKHYDQPYTGATPAYAESGNWLLYSVAPTLAVRPEAQTITYGEASPSVFRPNLSGFIDGDTPATAGTSGTATWSIAGPTSSAGKLIAGGHDVTLTGGLISSLGYRFADDATSSNELTVNPRPLTATYSAAPKTYDGTSAVTVSGSSAGLIAGDAVTFSQTAAFRDKNVGTAKPIDVTAIALGGSDSGNYAVQNTTAIAAADITARALTAVYTATAKVYDGTTAATVSGSSPDILPGDTVAFSQSAAFHDRNVGSGKPIDVTAIALGGADGGNYAVTGTVASTSADITPATLSYIARPTTAAVGTTVAGLTGSVGGFLGSDNLASDTIGSLRWTSPATATSAAGVYPINGEGLAASNYVFIQSPANATALALVTDPGSAGEREMAAAIAASVYAASTADRLGHPSFAAGTSRVADATFEQAVSFAPLQLGQMTLDQIQQVLDSRKEFKRKLFADAIYKLEEDPSLAEVRPCASLAETTSGLCRMTDAQRSELAATAAAKEVPKGSRQAKVVRLPQIERKIAILLGVDNYADPMIPQLDNAIADTAMVGKLFAEKLGYEVRIVSNPSKADIVRTLNALSTEVKRNDSVVIYYAGHGYMLDQTGAGYWLPSDASARNPRRWISNKDVSRLLAAIGARQVAMISDSCYSGAFTKESDVGSLGQETRPDDILARRSVVVMSSGGDEPVPDGGKQGHSIFAWHLAQTLGKVESWHTGSQIFAEVRQAVTRSFPQTPHYGASPSAGHQPGGDYLFEFRQLDDSR